MQAGPASATPDVPERACAGLKHSHSRQRTNNKRPPVAGNGSAEGGPLHRWDGKPAVLRFAPHAYSRTWMFLSAQIRFSSSGQTVTLTSPMCAARRRYMYVRDWPIPPPTESGI